MVSRPQYCSCWQWWAQETTLHLIALLGVQLHPSDPSGFALEGKFFERLDFVEDVWYIYHMKSEIYRIL